MSTDLENELLAELKNNLLVTWEDEETNIKLQTSIKNSWNYLNDICGTTFNFSKGSKERELLMQRCRYDWNNALEEFETNFKREILSLIMKVAVDKHQENKNNE